jgi:hypothetical protein
LRLADGSRDDLGDGLRGLKLLREEAMIRLERGDRILESLLKSGVGAGPQELWSPAA